MNSISEDLDKEIHAVALANELGEMVKTHSVNPFDDPASESSRELEMAELLGAALNSVGAMVEKQEVFAGRPNVIARVKGQGGGPSLMLAGHLDTVGVVGYDKPFDPVIKDGKLYGRGSCDMKAGLTAFVETVRLIKLSGVKLKGDLIIAGIVDEEHQMQGSRYIGQHGPRPDFAIIGEPTGLDVCPAHKGQLCMHIETFGKACHSSVPDQGVNAIAHMADVINAFADYNDELKAKPAHPLCGHASFSPGVIRGGDIASSVPDHCMLEVDRRIMFDETSEDVVAEYRKRLEAVRRKRSDFNYAISKPTLDAAALDTPLDSPVVTAISRAYEETLNITPKLRAFTGSTDAPNIGAPAVICGPGAIEQAHSLDEFVEIDQLTAATRIYLRSALALLS